VRVPGWALGLLVAGTAGEVRAAGADGDTLVVARVAVVSEGGGGPVGLEADAVGAPGVTLRPRVIAAGRETIVEADALLGRRVTFHLRAPGHLPASLVATAAREGAGIPRLVLRLDPHELPAIEAAVRWSGEPGRRTRSVSRTRFADAPIAWRDLGEWLAALPGVSVRSSPGGGQVVSVRGSRPEGVLVLLDGIPINDPMTGRADLSTIGVASLESATLVRGSGSAGHGSGALAGVLLLSSRRADRPSASGAVRLESFGGIAAETFASSVGGAGRAAVSLAAGRAENDFPYEDRTAPGSPVVARRNADGSYLSAALSAARSDLQLDLRYDGVERGTPGPTGSSLYDDARWRESRTTASLGRRDAASAVSFRVGRRITRWSPGGGGAASDTEGLDFAAAGELGVPAAAGLLLAARLRGESLSGDALDRNARRLTAGVSAAALLEAGIVTLEPALAVDAGGGGAAASPELGVRVPLSPMFALRGRAGRAFRLPTFADLYFASSHRVQANPELRPERVRLDAELGLDGAWERESARLEAGIAAWQRVTEEPIVWLASSVAVWSPRNLDRLVSTGLEFRIELTADAEEETGWRGWGSMTLDRSRLGFGANRNPVPYRPATAAALGLERRGRGWVARTELRWNGARTTSVAATRELPGFVLLDLALAGRSPVGGLPLEAELRVENVLDRSYELVELYPEPGRRISLTVRAR
jgi:outer membrane cobalamin receptor